jgi:hypothetical protein
MLLTDNCHVLEILGRVGVRMIGVKTASVPIARMRWWLWVWFAWLLLDRRRDGDMIVAEMHEAVRRPGRVTRTGEGRSAGMVTRR